MYKMMIGGKELWTDGKPLEVGDKVQFEAGRRLKNSKYYIVRASNKFFAVCTQPLNMIKRKHGGKYEFEKTVLYSIIDWVNEIRGPENLIFGMGAETDQDCQDMLERLTNGESEISHRNNCALEIRKVIYKKKIKRL